jgi:hypothetical protein
MYIRKWLNKKGRAFIEVDGAEYGDGGYVTIADCDRRIQLDFSVYDKSDFKKKIDKLTLIIDSLIDFRNVLIEQRARSNKK